MNHRDRPTTSVRRRMMVLAFATLLALIAASCSSSGDNVIEAATEGDETPTAAAEAAENATTAAVATTDLTLAGVETAQWADNVEITVGDDTFRFTSDGLPSHELPDQFLVPNDGNMPPFDGDSIADEFHIANTEDLILASPLDVEITLNPVYSDEITQTSLSTIGVMISGAQLFNDYEDQSREFIALDDNLSLDGAFFIDACNGHPLATGASYHYHGIPFCITDAVDTVGQHSMLIGYLFDGFPIYEPQDVGGEEPTDLDACLGHTGPTPEFDEDTYHYHVISTANYISECLTGVS